MTPSPFLVFTVNWRRLPPLPFLVLSFLGAVTTAPSDAGVSFSVYDSPKPVNRVATGSMRFHRFRPDISDADYLYEHPVVFVLKQEGKDELVAFLADRGLNALYSDDQLRVVLDALRAGGGDKIGVLLDLRKHTPLPQWRMPITQFLLPVGFNLVRLAQSDVGNLPWILVVDRDDLKVSDASRFEKVAEFSVHDSYVKIPLWEEARSVQLGLGTKSILAANDDVDRDDDVYRLSSAAAYARGEARERERRLLPQLNQGIPHAFPVFI